MKDNKSKVRKKSKKSLKNNKKKTKTKAKNKLRLSKRGLLTILVLILLILLIVVISINSNLNKNNLDRVSSRLQLNLNKTITAVEKNTKIKFYQSSSSEMLNKFQTFNYVTEPSSMVEVLGTNLPKWIIYAKIDKSGIVTQYNIYDFEILSNDILGEKSSSEITTDVFLGLSEDNLISNIGFKPYVQRLMSDGSKELVFRYNYQDTKTNNSKCIQLTFNLDENGSVTDVTETPIDYLNDIISIVQVSNNVDNTLEIGTS